MKYLDRLVRTILHTLLGDEIYGDRMVQTLISTGYPTILFLNIVTMALLAIGGMIEYLLSVWR